MVGRSLFDRVCRSRRGLLFGTLAFAAGVAAAPRLVAGAERSTRFNVLFIAIDDLRPQLGCYGHAYMHTPNIDRLATQGRLFKQHFVQVPTCGASRCALLTGRYPASRSAYSNEAFAALPREESLAVETLPGLFQNHGYATVSIGKITHSPDGARADGHPELPFSWNEVGAPPGKWGSAWNAFFAYADGSTRVPGQTPATERAAVNDDGYPDGLIADAAIAKLGELKDQPFFMAVGFYKPHLPFTAPQRYWEMYDPDELPPAVPEGPARDVDPANSLHRSGELTPRYTGFAEPGKVSPAEAIELRHAYAACVSYADVQVGRVLDELQRLGLHENTIVVVWGDHGWHLGEHGVWGKHTLHEASLRSPLIVRMPGMELPGQASDGIVESIDILPTLAELCGLEVPNDLDGRSLAAMLDNPTAPGKQAAFGFWAGGRAHSIRTDQFRYTEWRKGNPAGSILQQELYDHSLDPHETANVAAEHPEVVAELRERLHAGVPMWRGEIGGDGAPAAR